MDGDPVDVVRRGYDAVSYRYRADDAGVGGYGRWISLLHQRIPAAGAVLDLGCGCGVPVSRELAVAGHAVTGVDVSEVQIRRARRLVPGGDFLLADLATVDFPAGTFDAVVCLYAMIHLPLATQPVVLQRIARWLRPGGWFLATVGHEACTGSEENWLGGGATMWWSQADESTYHRWLTESGLTVHATEFVPEGDGGHTLFWAQRRAGAE